MRKRSLPIPLLIACSAFLFIFSCTKLDTTTLGSDLIPAVDNVNTFADTLDITSTQGIFDDSFHIGRTENNVLGFVNDPIFGQTEANIFLQPKPTFYPYYFGAAGDTLVGVDSVVLTLKYVGSWGDTTQLQTLNVYRITDPTFADSVYKTLDIRQQPQIGGFLGSTTVYIPSLKDTVRFAHGKDSINNQIRIKLDNSFAQELFSRDSTRSGSNNAFYKDSLFRQYFKGLAVKAGGQANALMYISLSDAATRLEVHYRKKLKANGALDTTYSSLTIASSEFSNTLPSATTNYIHRTYPANITSPSPEALYLQTGPGTYANLAVPALSLLSNRIVHRATINIEQIPEDYTTDSIFSVPPYMYLDLKDTGTLKWKPVYYDLNPNSFYDPDFKSGFPYFPGNDIDYGYFGAVASKRLNAFGQMVWYYNLNVTRHVQQIVTKGTPNYAFRLYPAFRVYYPQYSTSNFPVSPITLANPLAFGRIKIKSGAYPDPQKQVKLRMVIIWSKI